MAATVVDREPAAPAEEERTLLAEVYRVLHREPTARPQLLLDPTGKRSSFRPPFCASSSRQRWRRCRATQWRSTLCTRS